MKREGERSKKIERSRDRERLTAKLTDRLVLDCCKPSLSIISAVCPMFLTEFSKIEMTASIEKNNAVAAADIDDSSSSIRVVVAAAAAAVVVVVVVIVVIMMMMMI